MTVGAEARAAEEMVRSMTTAERLIRNLADAARGRVKETRDKETEAAEREVPFESLPVMVRKALLEFGRATRARDAAAAIIEAAGYDEPRNNNDLRRGGLQRPYKEREAAKRAVYIATTPRYQAIERLQNKAAVAVMDKRGAEAAAIVEQLRKDLEKV